MAASSTCRKCGTELGAGSHAKETTRAHSVPRTNPDGTVGRYVVVLCNKCFTELNDSGQLDAFAEKAMRTFPNVVP